MLNKDDEDDVFEFAAANLVTFLKISKSRIDKVRDETKEVKALKIISKYIFGGWPKNIKSADRDVQIYFKFRKELSYQNG